MFAQVVITIALVAVVAEALSRLLLGHSLRAAVTELTRAEPPPAESPSAWRQVLEARQRALEAERDRTALVRRTTEVTQGLVAVERRYKSARARRVETESQRNREIDAGGDGTDDGPSRE